jgi:hypothetical protein
LAVAVALGIALWDGSARAAVAALYGLGLAACGLALHAARLDPGTLGRYATLTLAAYLFLAGFVRRSARPSLLEALRLPPRDGRWFAPVQLALALTVAALGGWVSIAFPDPGQRLAGAAAVALAVPAVGLLGAQGRRGALVLGAVALAECALAIPDPSGAAPWLHRTALLLTALTATGLAYADVLPRLVRRPSPWAEEARRIAALLGALAQVTLVALMVQEVQLFDVAAKRSAMDPACVVLVCLSIAVLFASALRCAVQPGRDPFGLSEAGRTAYVYGAEVLLVAFAAHLRMTAPELFSGWLARYWTLAVMLLGFLGLGLSELFERRGLRVLAGPLRRTGLLLPAVPLTAYWIGLPIAPAGAFPQDLGQYAVLWFLLALLYGLAASLWRSTLFGLLSALAANFGVWSLLAFGGIPFLAHPQVWLIPPALILLAAEHLNRDRLPAQTASGLRYLAVCTVYVASTADLFIARLDSLVLPVVLALLAVAGVLAGIVLRVRAFLFLGVSFLLLDILSMIWHVAVDHSQPWLWWVSGIVLGVAILALFAVFEKRRKDVLRLIDEIRHWD